MLFENAFCMLLVDHFSKTKVKSFALLAMIYFTEKNLFSANLTLRPSKKKFTERNWHPKPAL